MILRAENICKSFHNGVQDLTVLMNVNFELKKKEIVSIMGQSGSGKSTLLNILGTLDKADSGSLEVCGQDTAQLSDQELSLTRNKHIGFVFQFHHLLPEFTAFENVIMPAMISGKESEKIERANELIRYSKLEERKNHYPSQLSGGERLRVAVIRAMIMQPDVILADEPTGNLDVENAENVLELFKQMNKDFDQSFVITTHNQHVADIAHRQFTIQNQQLILQ